MRRSKRGCCTSRPAHADPVMPLLGCDQLCRCTRHLHAMLLCPRRRCSAATVSGPARMVWTRAWGASVINPGRCLGHVCSCAAHHCQLFTLPQAGPLWATRVRVTTLTCECWAVGHMVPVIRSTCNYICGITHRRAPCVVPTAPVRACQGALAVPSQAQNLFARAHACAGIDLRSGLVYLQC